MTIDYDIVIIGAGPAGCACALALQGKGLKVALIDKHVFPRDKICGDAIPGSSFKAIDSINSNWGNYMKGFADKMDITASTAYLSKNKTISYKWLSYSYNSKRIDFDNFLFQLVKKETDTIILENKRLQKVTTHINYSHCKLHDGSSIKASMVVGCDGANSIVKRQLINCDTKDSNFLVAIRAYYKGIEDIKMGENEFHFIKGLSGYFWIFPLKDGYANVGFGIIKEEKKNLNNLRNTLKEITDSPAFANRFKNSILIGNINGSGLPIWTKKRPACGERFILCGDAASLIDPLQGHGIDKAIWSGVIAAKQIANCFKEDNFSSDFMKQYDTMLYNKFGRELSRNYLVMRILLRFPFLKTIIFKLCLHQRATNWIISKMKI